MLPIDTPINKLPINIQAIIKVVKLAVMHQVNVFTLVFFCKSADIVYFSTHMII